MESFLYRAVDADNHIHKGIVKAKDFEGSLLKLYEKRLYPLELQKVGETDKKLLRFKDLKDRLQNTKKSKEYLDQNKVPEKRQKDNTYAIYISILVFVLIIAFYVGA